MNRNTLVAAAMGKVVLDLVIENVKLVNVHTCEVLDAVIGVKDGYIAYVGYSTEKLDALEYIDAQGKYAIPGLIDAHMHIESTMATPSAFAQGILPHGTTTIIADPHEIANVFGARGIEMMLDASNNLPVKVFMMISSTVPSYEGMETSGASIVAKDVLSLLDNDRVLGLGEVMDFWGVVNEDKKITEIIKTARDKGKIIDGHTPIFSGRELQAFIAAGIDSDHTIMDKQKVQEKLRSGMNVQIQGRFITNELMEYINSLEDFSNILLVTDDVSADTLSNKGHIDANIRKAIECGLNPIRAIQATTINVARRMRLYDQGSISAGRIADIVLLDSLEQFEINSVFTNGQLVAKEGKVLVDIEKSEFPEDAYYSMKLDKLEVSDFDVIASINNGIANINTIVVNNEGSYTVKETNDVSITNGVLDISDSDMYKMAVFERHGVSGTKNIGIIKGIGNLDGAIATTYSHDCHNLVIIGKKNEDMALAANTLIELGGGMCAIENGEVLCTVPLPIGGILSNKGINDISNEVNNLANNMRDMGIIHKDPIMILSILALAVSPEMKITDLGIVDVLEKRFIQLINHEKEIADEL